MISIYESKIKEMHTKFGIAHDGPPQHLPFDEKAFRVACLMEELNEYAEADSFVDEYDALIDLIVFAFGTLERHGYPADKGFASVMAANLKKEVGNNPNKSDEGRSAYKGVDLVKPKGWVGPESELVDHLMVRYAERS